MGSHFFTTEALVIGSMRYGEADRIVTLYTRDRGRLSAIAKGVRRIKSKTGGRLEPFTLVRASFHTGRGSLYTVAGVETLRTFQSVRDQLFRISAVRRLFPGEDASVPAFNLLVRGIAQLAESSDQAAAANVVLATRLKLLVLLGYAPEMTNCAVCGAEGPFCGFSPGLGGVLCEACWTGDAVGADARAEGPCFALSAGAVATLQVLVAKPLAELECFDIDGRASAEVEHVLAQTLAYHGH
jgi:DNA repair protein RecO (recombination protein O)